jgi:NADH-quinone oxidoreductase subunit M
MQALLFLVLVVPAATAVLLMLFRSSLAVDNSRWVAVSRLGGNSAAVCLPAGQLLRHRTGGSGDRRKRPKASSAPANAVIQPKIEFVQPWLDTGRVKLDLYLGIDGISVAMIALTALLTVSAVLISWEAVRDRAAEFYAALLLLQTGLIGVFCSFDLILFYVFFEMTLIPLFFLIAVWGGKDRKWAAVKFFLYTLAREVVVTLSGLLLSGALRLQPGRDP